MKLSESLAAVGPSFPYHPKLCPVVGGVKACIFLCAVFWKSYAEHDGWVQMSMEDLTKLTGMSEKEQRNARAALKQRGILQEREDRLAHRMFYRIDADALNDAGISGTDETESPELPKGSFGELPSGSSTDIGKRPRKDPDKTKGVSLLLEPQMQVVSFLPESLQVPEFEEAWREWAQHRKERRKPLTPTSARLQLRALADMGPARAVAAIRHSIANGYQGIFEPTGPAAMRQAPGRAAVAADDPRVIESERMRLHYEALHAAERAEQEGRML